MCEPQEYGDEKTTSLNSSLGSEEWWGDTVSSFSEAKITGRLQAAPQIGLKTSEDSGNLLHLR